jgi:chaperone modulatory protein CbpM
MTSTHRKFTRVEAFEVTGLGASALAEFIEREWILPVDRELLDEEDLARIRLIQELRVDLGANDEAVPLILHLLDQLYRLRNLLQSRSDRA